MTVFNLITFPNVCRACLQTVHPEQMMLLDTYRPLLDATIGTFLQDITFPLPENVLPYMPTSMCIACLEVMEFFSKYRRKMKHLHEFLVALARVKLGDEQLLRELFESRTEHLELLFRDLDLCNKTEAGVEDLLQEYGQYMIASMKLDSDFKEVPVTLDEPDTFKELIPLDEESPVERFASDHNSAEESETKELITAKQSQKKKRRIIQTRKKSRLRIELELDNDATASDENDDGDENEKSNLNQQRYQCEICPYKSYHTVAFTMHVRKHELNEGKVGFVCNNPYCLRMFPTAEELDQHKRSNPHRQYPCVICGNVLKHRISLEVHMERHVGITRFECLYCSSSFHTRTELTNHIAAIHVSEDRAECDQCGAVFTSTKLLKQHQESHNLERNFHCGECGRSFKTQHHLNRHIKAVHTDDARFQCEHCDASYSRRDKLRMHVEKAHAIQTYFVCDICVRSFNTDQALQEHRYHHENPKTLECGTCLMVCLSQASFDRHTCITYQDNYICCGRDFKYHMLYNKHMMSHGIKVNARVKPNTNLLLGQERAMRASMFAGSSKKRPLPRTVKCKVEKQNFGLAKQKWHECPEPDQDDDESVEMIEVKHDDLAPDDSTQQA